MGVGKVALSPSESWDIPLAAIFCIAIATYVVLVIIGLSIRQCLLKKGICGGQCHYIPCCNCAELGLHCAQACCNWGPKPSCSSLLDYCCPTHQSCSCPHFDSCVMCTKCSRCNMFGNNLCQDSCHSCRNWCAAPPMCAAGQLCDCQSCSCTCTTPECSTINCLCFEVTIKGRGQQEES
ncbi:uncharacterized protein [Procambarus clarkii]|uniref:uncharacterized protein n=1 Tax=Procambarus clarkii TaxID=6728 RepID=UPI001E670562|nr:guanine nucleotide-binding protein subunit gamma 4-like [Procambarus clarkii]